MFNAKLITSVLASVLLMIAGNSYSQETEKSQIKTIANQSSVDISPKAKIFKLCSSKQTEFDNVTLIEFELGEEASVMLTVFDDKGNIVETLIDDVMDAGDYNVNYKSANKIFAGELTYKLEVMGISGVKNVFAVK